MKQKTIVILLAVAALAVLLTTLAIDKQLFEALFGKSDSQRILGKWKITTVLDRGQSMPEPTHCVFDGRGVTFFRDDQESRLAYSLDEDHSPGWLDLERNGTTISGIYEFSGDSLRICLNELHDGRPTAFESNPSNKILMVLTRR